MRSFAEGCPDDVIVQQVAGQLTWEDNLRLFDHFEEAD